MADSTPNATRSAKAQEALTDLVALVARAAGAKGARAEFLDGSAADFGPTAGSASETSIALEGKTVGRLLLFGLAEPPPSLEVAVRILAHHLRREEALAHAEHANGVAASAARRFEALFGGIPVACYTVDTDGLVMEWNVAAEARWGAAIALAWGSPPGPAVRPDDTGAETALILRALAGESVRERGTTAFPLRDGAGTVVGAIVTAS